MDALIRSAQLAPFRTRLSDPRTAAARDATTRADHPQAVSNPEEVLRDEIEKSVRAELASQIKETCEIERARAEADGYTAGLQEAQAAANRDLERTRGELGACMETAVRALEQAHQAVLSNVQASVGEVAFAAVCRFVSRRAVSESFVLHLVEHACAQLRAASVVTARLHPRDLRTLSQLLKDGELRIGSLGLKLVADESLTLGGCVIEAPSGQFDGGLEAQLRRLHSVLTGIAAQDAWDADAREITGASVRPAQHEAE